MKKIENYVDGKIVSTKSTKYLPVDDPSTGEVIAEVVLSDKNDYDDVIESSSKAFEEWSKVTPLKRSRILSKILQLLPKILMECTKELIAKMY